MAVSREFTQAHLDQKAGYANIYKPRQEFTMADLIEKCAVDSADNIFIHYGTRTYTYAEVNAQANQYARAALNLGLRCGDVAGVVLGNRPEFFFVLLGLAKIGVVASLINTQITGRALQHSLTVTSAKIVIVGDECLHNFDNAELKNFIPLCRVADPENLAPPALQQLCSFDVGALVANQERENVARSLRAGIVGESPFVLMFTSGTTGLPKAAITSHMRFMNTGEIMRFIFSSGKDDVFYCYLPLFHGAALMTLSSAAICARGALVIRRKFSAREFWADVRKYKVTVVQYIGEICRYLLNQPPSVDDRNHTLRVMNGAGLTTDVWNRFQSRFGIQNIFEGWGSTEANGNMLNTDNVPGSCGRIPYWEKTNLRLVRYDVETDSHLRDENGRMVLCKPGEVGEIIAYIINSPETGAGRFEGYTSPEATEKKILRNVFQDGDAWFSSGDLFRYDDEGYFYFVDRIGDTFRWKSENVSTSEVAEAFSDYPGLEVMTVYGVKVPEHDGRAGMASVVMAPGHEFDASRFYQTAIERLPDYAIPLFVRVSLEADMTSTFKLRRIDLQREGYNPSNFVDPLYIRSNKEKTYVPYGETALRNLGIKEFQKD